MISSLPATISCAHDGDHLWHQDSSARAAPEVAEKKERLGLDASPWAEIEMLGPRCRIGDAFAWESVFGLVWPALVLFIHRLYRCMDERDAEDIAQATLVAAVRGADTFRGQGSFRGWLFGIAAHQATTFHRAQSPLKRGAGQIVPFPSVLEFRDDGKSPADISAENDRADLLHRALEELEETDRDLVHLHYFGELTCKEIATVRRMNAKTVSTRLSRSKDKLLIILGRSHFTHADG